MVKSHILNDVSCDMMKWNDQKTQKYYKIRCKFQFKYNISPFKFKILKDETKQYDFKIEGPIT